VILVTGSRALADTPSAAEWCQGILADTIGALPPGSIVVHGFADGPDTWAWEACARFGVRQRAYYATGRLEDGVPAREGASREIAVSRWIGWTSLDAIPLRRRPLERNRAMVSWCAAQPDARCLALVAPWSRTHGTEHTAGLARKAGIAVDVRECPGEGR